MLRRLLRYIRPHRRYALFTIAFGFAGFLLSFVYPWIVGSVVDLVTVGSHSATDLVWWTELAALTGLAHAVVVYGRGHFNIQVGNAVMADMRAELFAHLQRLGHRFHTRTRLGSVMSRLLTDVHEATGIIYSGLIVAGMDAVQLGIAVGLLVSISWPLTLACALLFPLYAGVFVVRNPQIRLATRRLHEEFAQMAGDTTEQLSAQALIKAYGTEGREVKRFRHHVDKHHHLVVRQSHEAHVLAAAGELLVHLGTTIVLGFGGYLVLLEQMSAGMVMRFLGYVLVMYGPVRRFAELTKVYQTSVTGMRRVFEILDIEPDVKDPSFAWPKGPSRGDIHFEQVHFRYDNSAVLEGVSLRAAAGERIAIVGHSGAGKTTLISLVPRFYDVNAGRVTVDGVDVRHYKLAQLRARIAIVQQETFIFSGSVRDNIAYGSPGATQQQIERAAAAAHAHDFISELPYGYDTIVGERGVTLSGGQRQRLSIARAFLNDSRIIIFDEATSSLDAESESIVQQALEGLMRDRTCLIVAHRLSTIRTADRIIVLEHGRIVQSGSHTELMRHTGGPYARLVRRQA